MPIAEEYAVDRYFRKIINHTDSIINGKDKSPAFTTDECNAPIDKQIFMLFPAQHP